MSGGVTGRPRVDGPGRTNRPPLGLFGPVWIESCTAYYLTQRMNIKNLSGTGSQNTIVSEELYCCQQNSFNTRAILRYTSPSTALSFITITVPRSACQLFRPWIEEFSFDCHAHRIAYYTARFHCETNGRSRRHASRDRDVNLVQTNEAKC